MKKPNYGFCIKSPWVWWLVFWMLSATPCMAVGEDLTVSSVAVQLTVVALLVLLNAFFVAAEFALVKVRGSQLDSLAKNGKKSAIFSQSIVNSLDAYLSVTQFGIVISSLGLGFYGEPVFARLIEPAFYYLLPAEEINDVWIRRTAMVLAFITVTFLLIVFGKLMPKSLAIHKSLNTALFVSRPLHFCYLILKPALMVFNVTANWLLRVLFRVNPIGDEEMAHSSDELRYLVEASNRGSDVTETERQILVNTLELSDFEVRHVMTPRNEVITLDVNASFQDNWRIAVDSKHTRFPLIDGHLDQTVGIVHIKEMLSLLEQDKPDLRKIINEFSPVPESSKVDRALGEFLKSSTHMSVVMDEFGGAVGIIALEDMLEQIVGDIRDEFDEEHEDPEFFEIRGVDEFSALGSLALIELRDHCSLELDASEVTTVGGYVTQLLGRLPEVGETVAIADYIVTVVDADERRVVHLHFERTSLQPKPEERYANGSHETATVTLNSAKS